MTTTVQVRFENPVDIDQVFRALAAAGLRPEVVEEYEFTDPYASVEAYEAGYYSE